jgi:hypothetical protein
MKEVNILASILLKGIIYPSHYRHNAPHKNIYVNILGFLGTYGKDKYTLKWQENLNEMILVLMNKLVFSQAINHLLVY